MEPNLARVPIPGGEPEGPSAGAGASPCLASPVQLSKAPARALRKRTGQARLAAGRSLIRDTAGAPMLVEGSSCAADALGNVWYHRSCSVEDTNAMQPNGLHPVCLTATEAAKPSSYFTSYFNLAALASRPEPPPNCPVPPTLHVVAITVSCVPSSSSRTITHKLLVRAPRRSTISKYQAT
ncbi:hypothetical protein ACCO45_004853 [Purpureocillium lilacinum]|uniref:Uncharacterized protein n=1 Tax=Purpureocillium lilacinum TaxID=33203 RepID=A0ACC4DU05_PURLI